MDTNETRIYYAFLITSIVLGTIIIYFAITIYRNHRKHFKLLSQHFLAEMERLEKERTRIARDLHDELGPMLAVTQIHIQATHGSNKEDHAHLEKASSNIEFLTERFSGIARNLTPNVLVRKGLETALNDFFEQYREVSAIKMSFLFSIKSNISDTIALHIYRMIQEMIHNAVKHSGASEVNIHLHEKKKKLYMLYKDNGKGINTGEVFEEGGGLGLNSLKSRAEMLEGKMKFSSNEKEGTEYFFEIPLTRKYETGNKNSNSR
jgi:two-component system NarL family sensor kinase